MNDQSDATKEWFEAGGAREEHPIAFLLNHDGARKLAAIALRKYGHQPEAFATLAASLLGNMAQPEILSKSLAEAVTSSNGTLGTSAESDRRQMARILNAIQRQRKQTDLNQISLQLREKSSPEQSQKLMEKFVIIQRELREIENDRRSLERE
jgi:hypothetical protein